MDILNSKKVMMFKDEWIPLRTLGEPNHKIKVLEVNTMVIPGMTEKIVSCYLDWSEEDEWAEQCMLVETDPQFKWRYGCLVALAKVDVAGKATTSTEVVVQSPEPKDRIAQWLDALSAYQFSIEYVQNKHGNADGMSPKVSKSTWM